MAGSGLADGLAGVIVRDGAKDPGVADNYYYLCPST